MAVIKKNFGYGGANVVPLGSGGSPTLAEALRDIADDLAGKEIAAILSADATDLASAITLVNEIKGAINATAPGTYDLKTTKG